jgi:hypothetical protein
VEKPDLRGQRVFCMGDSITDGFSYPLLVKQALEEARVPAPTLICAGIGGDTAAGMEKRLERDVFAHKPTLVTLNAGINDVLRKVKPAEYEASVTHIAAEMKARGIPLLLLTTSVLGAKQAEADARAGRLLRQPALHAQAFPAGGRAGRAVAQQGGQARDAVELRGAHGAPCRQRARRDDRPGIARGGGAQVGGEPYVHDQRRRVAGAGRDEC